jgi:hypothetical protein
MKFLPLLLLGGCALDYEVGDLDVTANPPIELGPEAPLAVTKAYAQEWTQQAGSEDLDVTVIVDRSCSMDGKDMEKVGVGTANLIEDIDAGAGDWQVSFMTMDPSAPGTVGPFTRPAGGLDLSALWEISRGPLDLPRAGGEEGMRATVEQLPPQRPSAASLLIFITDEEDQSMGRNADGNLQGTLPVQDFYKWMTGIKPAGRVDAITVVPTTENHCGDYATRYIDLSENYLGHGAVNFCSAWQDWMSTYSFLTQLSDTFYLDHEPAPGTIVVTVDGVPDAGWHMVEPQILQFHVSPLEGSRVRVEYQYWP